MQKKRISWASMGGILLGISLFHQVAVGQQVDEVYNEKIRAYTTDVKFLPASVLNLLDDPKVPSPMKHFGEIAGAPGIMHNTGEIYGYFKKLDETSDRLEMTDIGTSEEGRTIHLAIIADEETMGKLDFYKAQLGKLADPRKITKEQAAGIIRTSKPIYYINGGLHSPETGSPEMLMELAYRLVTDTSETIRRIREEVIVVINPISEPDGWDKMRDWYYRYGKSKKEYSDPMPARPPYWGKYTVHDNNRDGFQVSQELTKATYRAYFEWHPTVLLDLHESVPLLYVSSGTGPYPETLEPTTINEWSLLSQYEMTELAAQGLPGVFTWAYYDGYYQGYLFWVANNHNSIGRFYETFGNAGSNTFLRDIDYSSYAGKQATSREWYRPDPATKQVLWSYRNNINYMQAGVLSALKFASINGELLLQNFYQKGVNNIEKGKKDSPQAYVLPTGQRDPWMVAFMVNQLRVHGIEVHEVVSGENKGQYVVLLDQPYRNLAVSLLGKQDYPKDAEHPPHDDLAWTFGYMYGVEVKEGDRKDYPANVLKMVDQDARYQGSATGSGGIVAINYSAQGTVPSALYWVKAKHPSASVEVLRTSVAVPGGATLSPGSLLIKGLPTDAVRTLTNDYGLDILLLGDDVAAAKHVVTLPRVAIFHTWDNTQDEGWVRFTLEQRGIPYTSIDKDDVKAGGLKNLFDVIILPNVRGNASSFIQGIDEKLGPMPYTKTRDFPSHGYPDATDDMTGGPGYEGVANLKRFTEDGGVLITMNGTTAIAAELGLMPGVSSKATGNLFHPGSIVQARMRRSDSPILYGFPELFPIYRGSSPLVAVGEKDRQLLVLQYGAQKAKTDDVYDGPVFGLPGHKAPASETVKDYSKTEYPYVLSGMVRNEDNIIGEGAVFDVPVGKGHVVAFTFNPFHRFQNQHDLPMVWNTLINWGNLGGN